MLFREIRSEGAWKFVLDLHPRVTVLVGLGPERQDRMARLLETAVAGRPPDVDAVVEIDGQALSLDEWSAIVADHGLDGVDPIVRGRDVPRPTSEAGEGPTGGESPTETLAGAEADAARADADLEAARASLASSTMRREAAERADDERGAAVPPDDAPTAGPDAAHLGWLRSGADTARREAAIVEERRGLLVQRVEQARAELERLRSAARAADVAEPTTAFEVSAAGLLQRLANLQARRAGMGAPQTASWLVESARSALEEARLEAVRAEQAARPVRLSDTEIAELEAAHRAVLEAEERADRPIIGPMTRRRLAEARAEEQALLGRLGLAAYSAYLLRGGSDTERAVANERLERARKALADAEAVWEELQVGEDSIGRAALDNDEADFRADASRLLGEVFGPGEDLASIGRRIEQLATSGTPTTERADRLDRQSTLVPLIAGLEEEIVALDHQRSELGRRADDLDRQAATVEAEQQRPAVPTPPSADEASEARRAIEEARDDERDARRRVEEAEATAAAAAARLAEARTRVARRSAGPVRQTDSGDPATTDAEIYLLARLAAVRSVGELGSLPLVLVEPLVGQDDQVSARSLELLARMSELIQVIYLSDQPAVVSWAEELGPDWAAVRRFGRPASVPSG